MTGNITLLIIVGVVMFAVLGGVTLIAHIYSLNGIKSRTVGDGQHGTARWANRSEIRKTYKHVPFTPEQWREQAKESKPPVTPDGQPLPQGIVVGCTGNTTAMVDTGDVHALMIGAAGVGKTAYWLYPCIEYACASGMSFLSTDTKGDIMRNYGQIAKDYGYHISVIDLRNPTRSNGNTAGGFIMNCPDQILCGRVLPLLAPIQMGRRRAKEIPVVSRAAFEAYAPQKDKPGAQ